MRACLVVGQGRRYGCVCGRICVRVPFRRPCPFCHPCLSYPPKSARRAHPQGTEEQTPINQPPHPETERDPLPLPLSSATRWALVPNSSLMHLVHARMHAPTHACPWGSLTSLSWEGTAVSTVQYGCRDARYVEYVRTHLAGSILLGESRALRLQQPVDQLDSRALDLRAAMRRASGSGGGPLS